eukprot:3397833-Pyramimonas_sp.AAC.1
MCRCMCRVRRRVVPLGAFGGAPQGGSGTCEGVPTCVVLTQVGSAIWVFGGAPYGVPPSRVSRRLRRPSPSPSHIHPREQRRRALTGVTSAYFASSAIGGT